MGARILILTAAVALTAACGGHPAAEGPDLPARELRVARVSELPADAGAEAWDAAREVVVPLLLQDVAEPRLLEKAVETLRLRALHDGSRVAFRLEWKDEAPEDLVDTDRSSDAAAIQLPAGGKAGAMPDSMMGEEGKPVSITLWRAVRQRRADGEATGVDALYPNRTTDHYPPNAAKGAENRATLSRLYEPPVAVGNHVADRTPKTAVTDLLAEGFGTLMPAPAQVSAGRGVHADGKWRVVITRPLDLAPGGATALRPGQSTHVAVAVWDGGRNQRGSLKMRSIWVPVEVEGTTP